MTAHNDFDAFWSHRARTWRVPGSTHTGRLPSASPASGGQMGLFDDWVMQEVVTPDYGDGLSLDEQFERWIAANPHVLEEFIRRARALKRQGVARFGAKAIIEGMRYDRAIRTGGDTFKLNNNYTSRLVRRALERAPDLEGFFELRALRSSDVQRPMSNVGEVRR